jgi:hypothetical protein
MLGIEALQKWGKLVDMMGDQDKAFGLGPPLQPEDFLNCILRPGVTAQTPDRFGGISNHALVLQHSRSTTNFGMVAPINHCSDQLFFSFS